MCCVHTMIGPRHGGGELIPRQQKSKRKCGSVVQYTFAGDLNPMPVCNLLGDGEAKAASIFILLGLISIKAAEDVGNILWQNAASMVGK